MEADPRLLAILRETIVCLVRQDAPDLTARQLAVFLICCLEAPHSPSEIAERLSVPRASITRAVDWLEECGLIERFAQRRDRRRSLVLATAQGRAFAQELGALMEAAAERKSWQSANAQAAVDSAAAQGSDDYGPDQPGDSLHPTIGQLSPIRAIKRPKHPRVTAHDGRGQAPECADTAPELRVRADRSRRLARNMADAEVVSRLLAFAEELDAQADAIEAMATRAQTSD